MPPGEHAHLVVSSDGRVVDWVVVPVDWRDWHQRPDWVRETIDAAVLRQQAAGHGRPADLPPHLRDRATRGSGLAS